MCQQQHRSHADTALLEKSLALYTRAAWPIIQPGCQYRSNWHLDCIYEHLEGVTLGQIKRLIINVPRRTSKTTSVAVMWPTWAWIKKPSLRWMFSSYSSNLGIRSALDRRTIITSEWYRDRWRERVKLSSHRFALEEYHNEARGRMLTTSVGGSTTGSGGDILVADDLLSITDSYSDAMRNKANQYYDQTFSTSADQWKESAIVIIMQRVHEDDLTGHVMKVQEEGWLKLSFPMEAEAREVTHFPLSGKTYVREAGDPLWEERFPKSMFPATRARLGSYGWAGQMQQRPSPLGGGMFRRSWWKFYDKLPEKFDHLFFSIDCAFKDKNTSDYVAGIAIGQVGANYYLLPIAIHDRLSFGRTKEAIKLLSEKIPGAGEKLVEDKANGTAVIDDLRDSIPGLIAVEPHGGKMARAHVASPLQSRALVRWPQERGCRFAGGFRPRRCLSPFHSSVPSTPSSNRT
jgi:hypothetical protein